MLGKKLKLLRESKQKSQQQVCSALNIEQSTLANYENGKRIPKLEILIKIAEYYQCSVDYLLGVDRKREPDYMNRKTDTSETPSDSLTEQEQTIIDIFRNLTDDNKDIIVGELKKTLRDQRRYEDTDLSVADDERITAELNNPNFKGFSKKSDAG